MKHKEPLQNTMNPDRLRNPRKNLRRKLIRHFGRRLFLRITKTERRWSKYHIKQENEHEISENAQAGDGREIGEVPA